ncbi:MAG TPA: AraC family transcriptional regulator, partial [Bacilli bacterium]
ECLMAISETSLTRVEQILHFLVIHLLREMRELDIVNMQEEEKLWDELRHTVGTKDLIAIINRLIDQCLAVVMNKKTGEILMMNAKDYIDRNLSSDLGIEELADYLKISCSYFSMLFKMHFGETFVEYITRQRMETAKSLLKMTDKSIAQIGKMCGYSERRYFTKVFQKYTGIPPSEFRGS